jgi:hypothetical protein
MSVQSIGQDTTSSWLSQLLASYSQQSATSQSSIASLLGVGDATSEETAATSSGSTSGTGSSVGSFNDILTALLSGDSSLSYDLETGTLTDLGSSTTTDEMPPPPPMEGMEGSDGLTREMTETENEDGSVSRSVTMTDADGNVVGTEETTQNTDGSFSSVITMTDPDGNISTRTITGENTEDGGFSVSSSLTDAEGNVLETGLELTAADGSVTRSLTRTTPEGDTVTDSESYDAEGALVSTSSSTTTTASSSSTSSETVASDSTGSSSESSDSEETTTTVTTAFTTEGMEQTTTVTDADGNIVSQNVKEIPFSSTAGGESYGNTEGSQEGLSGLVGQYTANRYGASRYAAQDAALNLSEQGGGLSVEA